MKRLYADGNTGLVAITNEGVNVNDPFNNLPNIYFHSSLNYIYVTKIINTSITLPFRGANSSDASSAYGSVVYNIGSHNSGYVPLVLAVNLNNNVPITGDQLVQSGSTASLRSVAIGADASSIFLRELYLNKNVSFGSITLNIRIYVFNEAV